MTDREKFDAKFEIDDGYVGGSRPQTVTIFSNDVLNLADDELEDFFHDACHEAMLEIVSAYGDPTDFVEWAREMQSKNVDTEQ